MPLKKIISFLYVWAAAFLCRQQFQPPPQKQPRKLPFTAVLNIPETGSISTMPTRKPAKAGESSFRLTELLTISILLSLKGIAATQVAALTMDSLAVVPADDISTAYPLLAEKFELTDEYVGFILNPRARFADGSKVTADDVIFSYRSLVEKGSPLYKIYYADVEKAEKLSPSHVRFTLKRKQ